MKYTNSTLFKCQLIPKLSGLDFYHIKYVPVILITLIYACRMRQLVYVILKSLSMIKKKYAEELVNIDSVTMSKHFLQKMRMLRTFVGSPSKIT